MVTYVKCDELDYYTIQRERKKADMTRYIYSTLPFPQHYPHLSPRDVPARQT